jgi:hypothetical protein
VGTLHGGFYSIERLRQTGAQQKLNDILAAAQH